MSGIISRNPELQFREPATDERALLERLLEANFPGRNELSTLLGSVLVRTIDGDGSLELESQVEGKAPVVKGVPVEAEGKDEDGATIHLLLYVEDGRPVELEFFREDGKTVKTAPPPSGFELLVLPPIPSGGRGSRKSR
jgi:hypothetical protein